MTRKTFTGTPEYEGLVAGRVLYDGCIRVGKEVYGDQERLHRELVVINPGTNPYIHVTNDSPQGGMETKISLVGKLTQNQNPGQLRAIAFGEVAKDRARRVMGSFVGQMRYMLTPGYMANLSKYIHSSDSMADRMAGAIAYAQLAGISVISPRDAVLNLGPFLKNDIKETRKKITDWERSLSEKKELESQFPEVLPGLKAKLSRFKKELKQIRFREYWGPIEDQPPGFDPF